MCLGHSNGSELVKETLQNRDIPCETAGRLVTDIPVKPVGCIDKCKMESILCRLNMENPYIMRKKKKVEKIFFKKSFWCISFMSEEDVLMNFLIESKN